MRKPSLLIQHDEHARIGGVDGKKVFIIDNAGNQIISFGSATITLLGLPTVSVSFLPYSFYQQTSLVSGYIWYGSGAPGSNPTQSVWKIQRETKNTGEILFANGSTSFNSVWSSVSLASISYS